MEAIYKEQFPVNVRWKQVIQEWISRSRGKRARKCRTGKSRPRQEEDDAEGSNTEGTTADK